MAHMQCNLPGGSTRLASSFTSRWGDTLYSKLRSMLFISFVTSWDGIYLSCVLHLYVEVLCIYCHRLSMSITALVLLDNPSG